MTAATAPGFATPGALETFRDDGPLARAAGAAAGRAVPLPAAGLLLIAGLPLWAAIALAGDGASDGLAVAVIGWVVAAGSLAAGHRAEGRFAWAVAPLLRLVEYSALIWIAALASPDGAPAAFALLAAVAFRHYDVVYRLRHQGRTPPAWVGTVAGGWEGRLLAALALMLIGALPAAYYAAAALLGALFVAESARSWIGAAPARPQFDDDEEDQAG